MPNPGTQSESSFESEYYGTHQGKPHDWAVSHRIWGVCWWVLPEFSSEACNRVVACPSDLCSRSG